uniref:30S ribosomal protein S11 n=1 Tax=Nephromyces sp. ex Molgula occidentalis TaxID=2544991 RepID=A0A5C1H8E1_9APIC|nr:30S ribosomal protein S11 [Nephromyces sp. ex Molgula occidentalis]
MKIKTFSISNKIINLYVKSTKKNLFISVIDQNTNRLLKIYSFGNCGFKGRKKNTSFSILSLISKLWIFIISLNYQFINLIFEGGPYLQRQIFLKTILLTIFKNKKLKILLIKDKTSFPFNGWRKQKQKNR